MIRFKMKVQPVWVPADRSEFDITEIGHHDKEERAKIKFLINPLDPVRMRELVEQYSTIRTMDMDLVDKMATVVKDHFSDDKGNPAQEFAQAVGALSKSSTGTDIDWVGYNLASLLEMLGNWEGLLDENDEVIECNEENIKAFYDGFPRVAMIILNISAKIRSHWDEFQQEQDKSEEKNSQATSSGAKTEVKK